MGTLTIVLILTSCSKTESETRIDDSTSTEFHWGLTFGDGTKNNVLANTTWQVTNITVTDDDGVPALVKFHFMSSGTNTVELINLNNVSFFALYSYNSNNTLQISLNHDEIDAGQRVRVGETMEGSFIIDATKKGAKYKCTYEFMEWNESTLQVIDKYIVKMTFSLTKK